MKQYLCFFYSDFQVKLLQEAKTLYISGSHKKWLKPQWSETVFIQAFKNKTCVTLCTFITQSDSDEAFKAGLSYLQKELDLSPEEVVLDPQANLTSAAIGVFGNDTKYKTCSYFFHNYLNQRADRLCLLNQNEDHNVKKLLWCLKALAFKPKSDIEGDFIKIQNFYKRFCCSYEQITDEFYNLFVRKLNLDYWNSNYMFKEDRERKAKYLELNRILEIHDMLLEKYLDETETFSSFCKGLAELERKFRMILEENDHIEVSNDDLDETNILADLLDQKFNIEMVMSHSFQLPHRENSMIGSSIESNFGVSPLANNPNANNVGVPNFNPYNANVGGGMNLSKRRGRRPSANIHHLAQNGTPVSQQPYTDSRDNRLNPFPSNFVS